MPKLTKIIPYASHNQRDQIPVSDGTIVTKDQRIINFYPELLKNAITQKVTMSLKRRSGFISAYAGADSPFVPSALGSHYPAQTIFGLVVVAYYRPTSVEESRIYIGSEYVGNIAKVHGLSDWLVRRIDQTALGGVGINVFSVGFTFGGFSHGTSLYYYPYTNYPATATLSATFTGDTHTSTTIDNIADTSLFYVGQALSGTDIAAGTRIATIPTANSITITMAATGSTGSVTITRTILAKVIDSDLSDFLTGGVAFLKGYMFVMTADAKIYNFDVNSVTSVSASNFISVNSSPDGGIGCLRQGDEIVGLGANSIEFFYLDSTNLSGSVLSPVQGSTINIGVDSETAYCKVGDKFAFVSSGTNLRGVWLVSGRTPQKISTSREDAILASISDPLVLSTGIFDGQQMLFCSAEGQTYTLAYCMESGAWWEVSASSLYQALTISGRTYVINKSNANGFLQRINDFTDGSISYKDAATSVSAGSVPTATAILDIGDFDSPDFKDMYRLAVECDSQSGTSNLGVQFSDEDLWSFGAVRTVDMTLKRKEIYRCGKFIKRAIKLTHSDDTAVRIRALHADIQ